MQVIWEGRRAIAYIDKLVGLRAISHAISIRLCAVPIYIYTMARADMLSMGALGIGSGSGETLKTQIVYELELAYLTHKPLQQTNSLPFLLMVAAARQPTTKCIAGVSHTPIKAGGHAELRRRNT